MFIHSENIDASIEHAEGLHSFKNRLTIMEGQGCRTEAQICKRNNNWFMPLLVMEIANEHMIGKMLSKLQVLEIYFMKPGMGSFADLDFCSQFHRCVFSLIF